MTPNNEQIYALADALNAEQILTIAGTLAIQVCAWAPDPLAAVDAFSAALRKTMLKLAEQVATAAQG